MGFSKNFVWGAATAAYQVEGAASIDGRGLSVWDIYGATPGKVLHGHTGQRACNHYERYKGDVGLMKEIGLQAYRFSVSWPRVLPEGVGSVNDKGLDFYDRLVDELLHHGIEPYITLFHWDFPYELYKKGGWLNRDSANWFADYSAVVVNRLSDRVKNWITLNEPPVFINLGHKTGKHAPGLQLPLQEVLQAAHHAMLGHGKAVQAIRHNAKLQVQVGYAPNTQVPIPNTDSLEDIEAARFKMFEIQTKQDTNLASLFVDPVVLGDYPQSAYEVFGSDMPAMLSDDLKTICQPLDFIGFNIYHGARYKKGDGAKPERVAFKEGHMETSMGWPVTPEALYWGPKFIVDRYKLPLYITENGMANTEWPNLDGQIYDHQRIDFLSRYLGQLKRLAEEGADLRGYFCWSLMDNYEWSHGYAERFGLIYVDYETEERTVKQSGLWYKRVIETNGEIAGS
ncbi:GH1 family beta-glucosidase [Paenibacillus sp. GYB004]|uniref:GH1 family beta-glucosidase n=1 Tax=Paenibacillus sp. GYB004 TaxID=2994393 RepID=UPI002F965DCD